MHIWELMTGTTKVVVSGTSCATVGAIMRRRRCGFVAIVDSPTTKRVTGVVTARDILLQLVRLDRPASQVAVKLCMTKAPATISSEADLKDAVRVMKEEAVSRLPVIDNGKLVGVLALQDIALAARRQWAYVGPQVTEQHVTEIIEAIAVAREQHQGKPRR